MPKLYYFVSVLVLYNFIALNSSFLSMLLNNRYTGELAPFDLGVSRLEITLVYLLNILALAFVVFIFFLCASRKIPISKKIFFKLNRKSFDKLFLLLVVGNLIFTLLTGVGVVLSESSHPFSFLFSIFNPIFLFNIYYILQRRDSSKLFFVNIFMFFLLMLIKGWTGFIFTIFLIEMYYFLDSRIGKKFVKTWYLSIPFVVAFVFIVGGIAYSYFSPIKNEIRGLGSAEMTYVEGITAFASRLSFFPISVGAFERSDDIVLIYRSSNLALKEVILTSRPLVPRFIFPNKEDFSSLNNDVLRAFYPSITSKTSSNFGLVMYTYILASVNFFEFSSYLIFSILLLLLVKIMLDSFRNKDTDIIIFLYLLSFFSTAAHEVISINFVGFIFLLFPILLVFKVISISRISSAKRIFSA